MDSISGKMYNYDKPYGQWAAYLLWAEVCARSQLLPTCAGGSHYHCDCLVYAPNGVCF